MPGVIDELGNVQPTIAMLGAIVTKTRAAISVEIKRVFNVLCSRGTI